MGADVARAARRRRRRGCRPGRSPTRRPAGRPGPCRGARRPARSPRTRAPCASNLAWQRGALRILAVPLHASGAAADPASPRPAAAAARSAAAARCARRARSSPPSCRASPGWCAGRARSWSGTRPSAAGRRAGRSVASGMRTQASRRTPRGRAACRSASPAPDSRTCRWRRADRAPADSCCITSSSSRTGSSNIAWRSSLVNAGEALAIDRVRAPGSGGSRASCRRTPPRGRAPADPSSIRRAWAAITPRLVQIAGGGARQQLVVRQARPEEVTEAAGQRVVGERLDVACGVSRQIEPVEEVRRHQDRHDQRLPHRVLVVEAVLARARVVGAEIGRARRSSAAGDRRGCANASSASRCFGSASRRTRSASRSAIVDEAEIEADRLERPWLAALGRGEIGRLDRLDAAPRT